MTGRRRAGFTLIELLVAMTTFSVVMGGVYVAFNDAARFWRESENDIDVFQQARVTMSVFERELRSIHNPAGFLMLGEDKGSRGHHRDELEFYTVSTPMTGKQQQIPQLMKVRYYLAKTPGEGSFELRRKEQLVEGPLPQKKDFYRKEFADDSLVELDRGDYVVLAENVESLEFLYSWSAKSDESDQQWLPECQRGRGPPLLIRVEMIITNKNLASGSKAFRTLVLVPCELGEGPRRRSL